MVLRQAPKRLAGATLTFAVTHCPKGQQADREMGERVREIGLPHLIAGGNIRSDYQTAKTYVSHPALYSERSLY